jgi:hypothetical protein
MCISSPDVPWTWPLEWVFGVSRRNMLGSEPARLRRGGVVDLAEHFHFSSKHSAVHIDLPAWVPRELEGSEPCKCLDPGSGCTDPLPKAVARFRSRALVRR